MAKPYFHSELAKLGEFWATLHSDVKNSQLGKANYVSLTINGDKRNHSMENQACEAVFRQLWQQGYRDIPILLKAEGWKDKATITFIRADQNVTKPNHAPAQPVQNIPPAQTQQAQNPPQQNIPPAQQAQLPENRQAANTPLSSGLQDAEPGPVKPPPLTEEEKARASAKARAEAKADVQRHARRIANTWLIAFKEAIYCRDQVKKQFKFELSEAQFQGLVGSINIQLCYDGKHKVTPGGIPNLTNGQHQEE